MRRSGALLALWLLVHLPGAASGAPRSLLAVTPRSPWTLRELERQHVDLVSYDPVTGVAYLTASAPEQRRLQEAGFALATVQPDAASGLRKLQLVPGIGLYHTYAETVAFLDSMHAAYPGLTRLESLGASFEGRDIPAIKISSAPQVDDATKPDVLVVGCHHAREFMSVEVPLDLVRTLLEGYGHSPNITRIVDTRELWVVPILNPDGHVYQSTTQERPGWRKNRHPVADSAMGVDPNRNYGYNWGYDEVGSSSDPASETYRGEAAFSEPETQAMRRFVAQHRFTIALSYHSFGRLVLYPWGYTRQELTPHQPVFAALSDSMVRENRYTNGNPYFGTIYLTNGDFDDYMYGELTPRKPDQIFSFTVELNSLGEGGFWPVDSMIAPTCKALLETNLFALRAADNPEAPLPPPVPVLFGVQDAHDGRRVHLTWQQSEDAANPVVRYEVFELYATGGAPPASKPASLTSSSRAVLASDLRRPPRGELVMRLAADLEALWDYAFVEVRPPGGAWQALSGEATRDASPTGRNSGHGLTGPIVEGSLRFRVGPEVPDGFDLAVRLDAHPDSPRRPFVRASLRLWESYGEERRVLDPNVHGTQYDAIADRTGPLALGITAVDPQGQKSDSELLWYVIPVVAVQVRDAELVTAGRQLELRWRSTSETPARFEAWTRPWRTGTPGDVASEWQSGTYTLVASTVQPGARAGRLAWNASAGRYAVLLRGSDADGPRLWGPWLADVRTVTRLAAPAPNPFNPQTRLAFELDRGGRTVLGIYAADGRLVRHLVDAWLTGGAHDADWDGKDDAGRAVASGLYVARMQHGAVTQSRRLVLLR